MTAFRLFSRSLPLLGSTGFIYLYNRTDLPYAAAPIIQVLFHILLILLMSGWWLDFLALKSREKKQYEDLGQRLRFVIIFVRCFAAVYLVLDWLIGKNSIILFWGRLPEREIKSAPFDGWSYGSAG
jgi:hypothetical protein